MRRFTSGKCYFSTDSSLRLCYVNFSQLQSVSKIPFWVVKSSLEKFPREGEDICIQNNIGTVIFDRELENQRWMLNLWCNKLWQTPSSIIHIIHPFTHYQEYLVHKRFRGVNRSNVARHIIQNVMNSDKESIASSLLYNLLRLPTRPMILAWCVINLNTISFISLPKTIVVIQTCVKGAFRYLVLGKKFRLFIYFYQPALSQLGKVCHKTTFPRGEKAHVQKWTQERLRISYFIL